MKNKFNELMVKMSYKTIYGDWDKEEMKYDAKVVAAGIAFILVLYVGSGLLF